MKKYTGLSIEDSLKQLLNVKTERLTDLCIEVWNSSMLVNPQPCNTHPIRAIKKVRMTD